MQRFIESFSCYMGRPAPFLFFGMSPTINLQPLLQFNPCRNDFPGSSHSTATSQSKIKKAQHIKAEMSDFS
jgi:hypothetical protein